MVKYKTLRRKRSLSKFKVGMVSLGCDKNRVDSELILGSINKFYEITNNPKDAEIIIINTCLMHLYVMMVHLNWLQEIDLIGFGK